MFQNLFKKNKKGVVDKLEVISAICLISSISSEDKVIFLFNLFDFHNKGYLTENEISLLFHTVTDASTKLDSNIIHPTNDSIQSLVHQSLYNNNNNNLRRPEFIEFITSNSDVYTFLDIWRGHSSQVLLHPNNQVNIYIYI